MIRFASLAALTVALISTGCATTSEVSGSSPPIATADIVDATGANVGTARITAEGGAAVLHVDARMLKPGQHGLHLHTVGRCEMPSFTSAGAHLNPASRAHGMHNPSGPHLGDLPNLVASADGTAQAKATISGSIEDLRRSLFDQDGTAIVVHDGPDDYMTDPSGNSGSRIGCGVFRPG